MLNNNKIIKAIDLFIIFFLFSFSLFAQSFASVKQLAERRVSWLVPYLSFDKISNDSARDVFELFSKNDTVFINANNVNSAAMGLSWYLEKYCHRSMSHLGDNLSPVFPIPKVNKKIRIASPFSYRYALNYCTYNYTMSFYSWEDWEWELDWMALHGVNLMLAPIGTEAVWRETLKELGFSKKEIRSFLPGPAFNAWWLMGNLDGWGGPITTRMISRRTYLQQTILERMKDLGIEPVLQGFYGMIPRSLKKHFPDASVIDQGIWEDGRNVFKQPDMLSPSDSLFKRIARIYYSKIKNFYGVDIKYLGGDPFHEGGNSAGVDLAVAGKLIQDAMQESYPGSTWVLQGWRNNPQKQMLKKLDHSKSLIIQLGGELHDDWFSRKGYGGIPFIWSIINNFGGRPGNYGQLQFFIDEVNRIRKSPYQNLCKGVGIAPEGIDNNPVVYDLVLELGWSVDKVSADQWIKQYIEYRYGKGSNTLNKSWDLFLETVYKDYDTLTRTPASIFCARPAWDIKSLFGGNLERNYNMGKFALGVKYFLSAQADFLNSQTYHSDAIDFSRQVLSNQGVRLYKKLNREYRNKNIKQFKKDSRRFLDLILLQDSLLSLNKYFRLETWIKNAKNIGASVEETKLLRKNALSQITYWGPDNESTPLHDYAYKEWSGLLRSFYYVRWKKFLKKALSELKGSHEELIDFYQFETDWVSNFKGIRPLNLSQKQKEEVVKSLNKEINQMID